MHATVRVNSSVKCSQPRTKHSWFATRQFQLCWRAARLKQFEFRMPKKEDKKGASKGKGASPFKFLPVVQLSENVVLRPAAFAGKLQLLRSGICSRSRKYGVIRNGVLYIYTKRKHAEADVLITALDGLIELARCTVAYRERDDIIVIQGPEQETWRIKVKKNAFPTWIENLRLHRLYAQAARAAEPPPELGGPSHVLAAASSNAPENNVKSQIGSLQNELQSSAPPVTGFTIKGPRHPLTVEVFEVTRKETLTGSWENELLPGPPPPPGATVDANGFRLTITDIFGKIWPLVAHPYATIWDVKLALLKVYKVNAFRLNILLRRSDGRIVLLLDDRKSLASFGVFKDAASQLMPEMKSGPRDAGIGGGHRVFKETKGGDVERTITRLLKEMKSERLPNRSYVLIQFDTQSPANFVVGCFADPEAEDSVSAEADPSAPRVSDLDIKQSAQTKKTMAKIREQIEQKKKKNIK